MTSPRRYKAFIPVGSPLHRIPKAKGRHAARVPGTRGRTGGGLVLHPSHPAILEARALFQHLVTHPHDSPRLLVSGENSRKIGKRVTKGRWKTLPIYTLTLEERRTCPATCQQWLSCYGNGMPHARRHVHGLELETGLIGELVDKAQRHPRGFAVRLHVLGDFYSEPYVDLWAMALDELPTLRVFGFTAHDPASPMGQAIRRMNRAHPARCRIRFSGHDLAGEGSLVIEHSNDSQHVLCPAQSDKTDCCGSCGLCWAMDRTVEFVRH